MSNDQKNLVLRNVKDSKGNTLLHTAVKVNNFGLARKILEFNTSEALVRNSKGKLPCYYCKSHETMNLFQNQFGLVVRNVYHTNSPVIWKYPELLELCSDTDNHVLLRMEQIALYGNSILRLYDKDAFYKICNRARDPQGNNFWHACVKSKADTEYLKTLFPYLNKSIINERNVFGNTPLHVAESDELKILLIKFGAHSDCLNLEGKIAYKIVLNLQCIASRHLPKNANVPPHLKNFVELHKCSL
ncbi:hypothetical protein NPIL_619801 [Nephila pilipes]|uniref:Uncharacterized protein n=1 Tax=Nephila pilipes TaxID=299642 RepID=A0A8X6NIS5_NEPPI|nr:hypothetical protein NPIL_619801 [Nephila pilipes]